MGVRAQTHRENSQSIPQSLLDFVVGEASRDADAVVHFLSLVEQRSGETWERPIRFPAAFLLGAGAALRLGVWEVEGFFPHLAAGLPNSMDAMRRVVVWCLNARQHECDRSVLELVSQVYQISVSQFAWEGPAILGGNVLLQGNDGEDQLIAAIAELAWKNRHKEFGHDEPTK